MTKTIQQVLLEGSKSFRGETFFPVQFKEMDGRTLVYFQAGHKIPYGIICGWRASEPYETPNGLTVLDVELLSPEEGIAAMELLTNELQGPLTVWQP